MSALDKGRFLAAVRLGHMDICGVDLAEVLGPQVRNLASCIKAAIDFVSPESFEHVLGLTQERRMLTLQEAIVKPEEALVPPAERRHADKLQVTPSCLSPHCRVPVHAPSTAPCCPERGRPISWKTAALPRLCLCELEKSLVYLLWPVCTAVDSSSHVLRSQCLKGWPITMRHKDS